MTTAGYEMGVRRRLAPAGRSVRGVTFLELIIVVGIISTFSVLLISGYRRFQSGFRASSALSKVESAINYARNLSIANNAIYHVRFESCEQINNVPSSLATQQAVGIYCFPDMSTALGVTHESQVTTGWNPFRTLSNRGEWSAVAMYDVPNVVAYNGQYYKCISALPQPPSEPGGPPPTVYPPPDADTTHWQLGGQPHNNTLVEKVMLPAGTWCGVQHLEAQQAPFDKVLFFRPDGSASGALTVFVTDSIHFADKRFLSETEFNTLNENRRKYFNDDDGTHKEYKSQWHRVNAGVAAPWLKMIQIYGGGMIKQRAVPNAKDNNAL